MRGGVRPGLACSSNATVPATTGVAKEVPLAAIRPFPEALRYLWERFLVLHGMRAQALHGLAPFTPEMLYAADRLFRWRLAPIEVEGLRVLDVAWRHPEALHDEDAGEAV